MTDPESITLKITKVIDSTSAISSEDAEELYKIIDSTFAQNKKVVLDFSEIELLLSVFLNVSIGQLYSKYDYSLLDNNQLLLI
ncbi:MAG: STAS-like domain-containing protein [Chitinophagaceae bacterium]